MNAMGTFFEQINELKKSTNCIVYGCGEAGDNFHRICKYYNINICGYVDTYFTGFFYGREVWDLEEFKKNKANTIGDVVICAGPAFDTIRQNVLMVMPDAKIYDGGELFYSFLEETFVAEPFLSFYATNINRINDILDKLDDEYSRDTVHAYCKYLQTKNAADIDSYWHYDQYFPKGLFSSRNGCFIDAGAYNGKTAKEMCEKNPDCEKVICFEPIKNFIPLITKNLEKWRLEDKVEVHNAALYSENGILRFDEGGTGSTMSDKGIVVTTEALDELELDDVSFVKMDIEGAELEALKGARNTIIKCHPYLAVCIYHKPEDIIEIPTYIMNLGIKYKYYIRLHEKNHTELVFYAIPEE